VTWCVAIFQTSLSRYLRLNLAPKCRMVVASHFNLRSRQFPAVLYFSKLFLRLLQIDQSLFEFCAKDLRLLDLPEFLYQFNERVYITATGCEF
jgi:hypothetical protein